MPTDYQKHRAVSVRRCEEYDPALICELMKIQLDELKIDLTAYKGKKAVIKPNLLSAEHADKAMTTHPAVLEAMIRLLHEMGAEVVIAESPGGAYTEAALRTVYNACGIAEVAERTGATLNFDTTFRVFHMSDGRMCSTFNILTPILDADIVLNLCKLKTHSLATVTCAAKNLFGTVPGLQKFEMHARFQDQQNFLSALCDLCHGLCSEKRLIHICDAVVGMEGNGPRAGSPRKIGCLLASENPFALDLVASHLIGLDDCTPTVLESQARGLCPASLDEITVLGDGIKPFLMPDFVKPDASGLKFLQNIPTVLQPRPEINNKLCVGCGVCKRSCPVKAIAMIPAKRGGKAGKKRALINREKCIRCYCCQELCPYEAVNIHRNPIYKALAAFSGKAK